MKPTIYYSLVEELEATFPVSISAEYWSQVYQPVLWNISIIQAENAEKVESYIKIGYESSNSSHKSRY
jgi:hypothetical protein